MIFEQLFVLTKLAIKTLKEENHGEIVAEKRLKIKKESNLIFFRLFRFFLPIPAKEKVMKKKNCLLEIITKKLLNGVLLEEKKDEVFAAV